MFLTEENIRALAVQLLVKQSEILECLQDTLSLFKIQESFEIHG